jgi:hypothetical protein
MDAMDRRKMGGGGMDATDKEKSGLLTCAKISEHTYQEN